MPKFVIERRIPNAGDLSPGQLRTISETSCVALKTMGPQIQWIQSYVTDNAIICTYSAPDEESIREHARQGGFPVDRVMVVHAIIDPSTPEGSLVSNGSKS